MCPNGGNNLLTEIVKDFLMPLSIGVISYILFAKMDQWKTRKKHSRLGVAIMDSLIEEVNNGIIILKYFIQNDDLPKCLLPNKSWSGLQTINDDVLLRIIEVSKDKMAEHFPPKEIRIHCKNYFDIMTNEWNKYLTDSGEIKPPEIRMAFAKSLINERRFLEAAEKVLKMLEQTRLLLNENVNRIIPR
jgi:hypothetical protein